MKKKINHAQKTIEGEFVKLKEGYILDAATGKPVDGRNPEEEVRQEYEKILHENYAYDYKQMDINVQIRRGAKKQKGKIDYADIVIYKTTDKSKRDQHRDVLGIVETKRPNKREGIRQLMSYMSATSCSWGVWTNGKEIEYLYKDLETGEIKRDFIYQIPSKGETFEDIGRLSKKELKPAKNLKPIFRRILYTLYANTNISRREKLGSEMIRLLFCKIWDERYNLDKIPKFRLGFKDKPENVKKRVLELFEDVKEELVEDGVFDKNETIIIDAKSVMHVVGELEKFSLSKTNRDVIGDAFEVFAESKFVGEKGEFFTPREVVKMCVKIIDPKPHERILDPACGSGGFLIYALEHVWDIMDNSPKYKDHPKLDTLKKEIAEKYYFGIDKEIDLVKIAKAYMSIVGDGKGNIVQADSLKSPKDWSPKTKTLFSNADETLKQFDIILTNPPFGAKIKIIDEDVLENYDLGHRWKKKGEASEEKWKITGTVKKTEPQILFIERCLDFLKPGGRMAIVLPDGIFGNPTDGWVRQWIKDKAEILAIIDCPPETFMPHTHTKTSVLFLRKWDGVKKKNYPIFCGIVKKCGHDARGNDIFKIIEEEEILDEEFSEITQNFLDSNDRIVKGFNRKGFTLYEGKLKNGILIPRYYNPDTVKELENLEKSGKYELIPIKELIDKKIIKLRGAGSTVSPTDYGSGNIPFIRTSDISNWEINYDATHKVAEDLYYKFKEKQDLKAGDILFIKDGTYLIGDTAILTKYDLRILVQSHFTIIRCLNEEKLDPFLLLFLLNIPIVKKQIDEKTFVQATLSTIGDRLSEVILPIPKSKELREKIAKETKERIIQRTKLREELKNTFFQ
ncbi:MAG TPA: hypothetical protein ENI52_03575 [Thermoplasmata archaeon]|nr:hypothetical protein [Thermoplasmata archaeon]